MFRENRPLINSEHFEHNFVLNHGAIGDYVASLPPIAFARMMRPKEVKMTVWVAPHQMELTEHLLKPYGEFTIKDLKKFPTKRADRVAMDFGPVSLNAPVENTHTRNATHLVDFASEFLIDRTPQNMRERSYVTEAPLGERVIDEPYIVFCSGHTATNRAFKAEVMTPIMQWCLENGYRPVIMGTKTIYTKLLRGDGTPISQTVRDEAERLPASLLVDVKDMREKTTLMQARDLLGHASAVVGIDGGLLHLAGTTDTNIVYGMTTTIPRHRYIPRHGDQWHKIMYVVPENLECAGCQSNWVVTYFEFGAGCPYKDDKCTSPEHMNASNYITALTDLLRR